MSICVCLGLPPTITCDFAEIFEINPTLTVATALSAAVVISGSNDITEAMLVILDAGLNTIKLIDVTIGGSATMLHYNILRLGSTFNVALIGNIDDAATSPQTDYSLNISAVLVPAAVWLFGTAVLGLIGFRRKAQLQVAA